MLKSDIRLEDLKPVYVALDAGDVAPIRAYVREGFRWNGWERPYFLNTDALVEYLKASGIAQAWAVIDGVTVQEYDGAEFDIWESVVLAGGEVAQTVGAGAWCWELVDIAGMVQALNGNAMMVLEACAEENAHRIGEEFGGTVGDVLEYVCGELWGLAGAFYSADELQQYLEDTPDYVLESFGFPSDLFA